VTGQTYPIEPIGAPRMTRADVWKKRPVVLRYREFRDACRAAGVVVPDAGARVTFCLPMPPSWSKRKRAEMDGKPHQSKPDADNMLKALLDALYDDDAVVWDIAVRKVWAQQGAILVAAQHELE